MTYPMEISMKWLFLLPLSLLTAGSVTIAETPPPEQAAESVDALPENVVARINGTDIPFEWFLHEFRSSFFRYQQSDDVRQAVLQPFMTRMLLAAKAREMNIDQRPEIQEEINRRITGMRAYMEYQLAMTEIGILNSALIQELGINTSPDSVTDKEIADFFDAQIKNKPGAPDSVEQIPAANLQNIIKQIAQTRVEQEVMTMLAGWTNEMTIIVNDRAVENVPMPEMKGQAPQGLERLPGPVMR